MTTESPDSWVSSPTIGMASNTAISLGEMFRDEPGKLLDVLDKNLGLLLPLHPELTGERDPLPFYPSSVSLVDLNDFYGMMECEIFSNYVNLFLNLPLFSRRMTYKAQQKLFSLDPPLKRRRFRVDHQMISAWVFVCRLPYFLKSHLYLEYKFSFGLLDDLYFEPKSLHLYHELKTPVGVNRFRVFLESRQMAKLICFWMDSENFHLLNDDKTRKEAFNAIEILYLKQGSRFELPEVLRKSLLERLERESVCSFIEVMVHSVPLLERIKKKEVDKIKNFADVGSLLLAAQSEVMMFLRTYWIPRYFIRNGQPYAEVAFKDDTKKKSHLVWGTHHRIGPTEPLTTTSFNGQAPSDFEGSLGERLAVRDSVEKVDEKSIWNLDLSKKGHNTKRKEKKALRKFTLFEQARKRTLSRCGTGSENSDYMQQLSELRRSHQLNMNRDRSGSVTPLRFNANPEAPESLGEDFTRTRTFSEHVDVSTLPRLSLSGGSNLRRDSLVKSIELKLPSLNESPESRSPSPKKTRSLAKTSPGEKLESERVQSPRGERILSPLSEISIPSPPDPYLLLAKVNPELLQETSTEQLNTRKWLLGAVASNCLAGHPLRDYLRTKTLYKADVNTAISMNLFSLSITQALNNLDCWERIERIRATAGISYAGRRADEVTNAGGWGGLDAPKVLPTYHQYFATVSGELLEAHLQPWIETKYIVSNFLCSCEKLGLSEEVRVVLHDMLKSYNVDDSWFALLQEHNLVVLRAHVLNYFMWDDERLLVNCAPSKEVRQHRVKIHSRSESSVQHEVFDEQTTREITTQYVFSPRSDQVWLSLFALEVSSYRPSEVYFPPIPTTTKSIGSFCTVETIQQGIFETKQLGNGLRPRSTLMTESQANLLNLKGCRTSPAQMKKRVVKRPLIKRIESAVSMSSVRSGSETSVATGIGGKKKTNKKLYPNTFKMVLADTYYFGVFMKYLELNLADETEAPLINFWHQVEIMKSYKTVKARKEKAASIHKKYLHQSISTGKRDFLNPDTAPPQLVEIAERKNITPNMMVNAQVYVRQILEEKWWGQYKTFMDDESSANMVLSSRSYSTNANISCGKDYRTNIRYHWGVFSFDLINFQRGLENQGVYEQFKNYLRRAAMKIRIDKGKKVKDGAVLTVINGVTVIVDRLDTDLDFFTEISKWVSMKCDMGGKKGKLEKSSERLLTTKAKAIVACYLKSVVPPKIRVNLLQGTIAEIEKRTDDNKKFCRGLFYHAVLQMITILLPFWKKFCFILAAKSSLKDQDQLQTVSGHTISEHKLTKFESREVVAEDKHLEKLKRIVDERTEGAKDNNIKGIRGRAAALDKSLARRDAFLHAQRSFHANETRIYQFCLSAGLCHVRHESGFEEPYPCETLLTAHMDEVDYLRSPLPRLKSTPQLLLAQQTLALGLTPPKQRNQDSRASKLRLRKQPSRALRLKES